MTEVFAAVFTKPKTIGAASPEIAAVSPYPDSPENLADFPQQATIFTFDLSNSPSVTLLNGAVTITRKLDTEDGVEDVGISAELSGVKGRNYQILPGQLKALSIESANEFALVLIGYLPEHYWIVTGLISNKTSNEDSLKTGASDSTGLPATENSQSPS